MKFKTISKWINEDAEDEYNRLMREIEALRLDYEARAKPLVDAAVALRSKYEQVSAFIPDDAEAVEAAKSAAGKRIAQITGLGEFPSMGEGE